MRSAFDIAARAGGNASEATAKAVRPAFQECRDVRAMALRLQPQSRSEEHTSELQSLMRISYAVFCLKKKKTKINRKKTSDIQTNIEYTTYIQTTYIKLKIKEENANKQLI